MLLLILAAIVISSALSLACALGLTLMGRKRSGITVALTALSSGVLLSTALLHLGPEAAHEGLDDLAFVALLIGILIFFFIERLVIWYHHHDELHDVKPAAYLIAVGDTIHNFLDGVAIAAAFLINPELGLLAVIAISLHEIPQEVADFTIMTNKGFSIKKATIVNIVSAGAALLGGIGVFVLDEVLTPSLPWLLGISAGMFLYIALADLIPELHHHAALEKNRWPQVVWLLVGIAIVVGLGFIASDH